MDNFNPRSPCGERRTGGGLPCSSRRFQSTLPVRGATWAFTHLHHTGPGFQSTLPVRGATRTGCCSRYHRRDFNPRSPCGERQNRTHVLPPLVAISIHAPRAGSDGRYVAVDRIGSISIHAPRAGSDYPCFFSITSAAGFQSTLPVRGATEALKDAKDAEEDFNPRSPCGERLLKFESLFGFSNNSCMVIRFLAAPSSLL